MQAAQDKENGLELSKPRVEICGRKKEDFQNMVSRSFYFSNFQLFCRYAISVPPLFKTAAQKNCRVNSCE
jgi:hypothetical protein